MSHAKGSMKTILYQNDIPDNNNSQISGGGKKQYVER